MQPRLQPRAVSLVIIIADDEVLIRLMAADIVHDAGFKVVEACSADETVALLTTGVTIDLILPTSLCRGDRWLGSGRPYPLFWASPVNASSGGELVGEVPLRSTCRVVCDCPK